MVKATVSEIHAYPIRPEGYAEPLFQDRGSRRQILEHLARSDWLWRASEQPAPGPTSKARTDTVAGATRVISRWREVDRWWEPDGGVDAVWTLAESDRGGERIWAEPSRTEASRAAR